MIKILIGGSPCTHWSIARGNGREVQASGLGWNLYENFLIAREKFEPDLFLYENNWSASPEIKNQIANTLGFKLLRFNSNLVSAQNRDRFYVVNWEIEPPLNRNVMLQDILEFGFTQRVKSKTIRVGGGSGWGNKHEWDMPNPYRKYTLTELCRLQTLPDNYCNAIPENQARKCLGNGWTAEMIIYLLNKPLSFVDKNEKIVVLSLYDGIATGRYCLDRMGFNNVDYHAYEIDKYAIRVALSNYLDIKEHGDAFQVRNPEWKI